VTNNVLLDNVTHKDLKIITRKGAAFGDDMRYALIVPREFRQAEGHYPIVFRKNPASAEFESVVLFGFSKQENLFLDDSGWHADYIPLSVQRIPFVIGYTNDRQTGMQQPVIHVDMDHPRISYTEGESVFLTHGGNSAYLERVNSILAELISGVSESKEFISLLLAADLLEAFTLKIKFENSPGIEMTGFYTINEEKLNALSSEVLAQFHSKGFLECVYMALASLSRLSSMIKKKQVR
jgi:hypothetical protein